MFYAGDEYYGDEITSGMDPDDAVELMAYDATLDGIDGEES